MCSTFKQRPIRPPLAGIVAVALLLLAATLGALSLSGGATLDPEFAPEKDTYTASVDHTVASLTVTAYPQRFAGLRRHHA